MLQSSSRGGGCSVSPRCAMSQFAARNLHNGVAAVRAPRRRRGKNCAGNLYCISASKKEPWLRVEEVSYQPAGSGSVLLADVSLRMPARGLGIIIGRSGSGKTTLLTMLAGLSEPTSGTVTLCEMGSAAAHTPAAERAQQVGLVFQFPERHFLGATVRDELTFGWPRSGAARVELAGRLSAAMEAAGLGKLRLETPVRTLSGGFQRRLALAMQLVRRPKLLLLDEPLAGVDWGTRQELVPLLEQQKRERAVLVVTHDLRDLAPIADFAWRMMPGGRLEPAPEALLQQRMGLEEWLKREAELEDAEELRRKAEQDGDEDDGLMPNAKRAVPALRVL